MVHVLFRMIEKNPAAQQAQQGVLSAWQHSYQLEDPSVTAAVDAILGDILTLEKSCYSDDRMMIEEQARTA